MTRKWFGSGAVLLSLVGAVGIGAASTPASADLITLPAARDTTLFQPNGFEVADGAGPDLFIGQTDDNFARRAALFFDLSGIPSGAVITDAVLTLHLTRTPGGSAESVVIHRLLANWGTGASAAFASPGQGTTPEDGDATWTHRFFNSAPETTWTAPGGDFDPASSASTSVNNVGAYTWSGPGLVADLQSWLSNPSGNFGWLLVGDETTTLTARKFGSSESLSSSNAPSLAITFTIPEPASFTLVGLGATVVLRRKKRRG